MLSISVYNLLVILDFFILKYYLLSVVFLDMWSTAFTIHVYVHCIKVYTFILNYYVEPYPMHLINLV